MARQDNPADEDAAVGRAFCASLSAALLESFSQYLRDVCVGLVPALLFIACLWRPSSPVHSRLIRVLLSSTALLYFPFLVLWTSIITTVLLFLLRKTAAMDAVLRRLCDAVTRPVVGRLGAASTVVRLDELQARMAASAQAVLEREADDAKKDDCSPLHAVIRGLAWLGLRAALVALAYVVEHRFRDAVASVAPGAPPQLSLPVVVAILRAETVGAALSPFKASVRMYLYGTLVVAAALVCGPILMLR